MEKIIESVGLIIRTKDNRSKEIPLEVWQVGAVAEELGLQVRLPNLHDYQMHSQKEYERVRNERHYAIQYFYKKVKESILKVLGEYGIRDRKEFYEKKEEEIAEIYRQFQPIQEEFHLSEEEIKELVEDIL